MPGASTPSDARTQGALVVVTTGATEDAAARRVWARRAPPMSARRPTWLTLPLLVAGGGGDEQGWAGPRGYPAARPQGVGRRADISFIRARWGFVRGGRESV